MSSEYEDAVHRFLGWFAVACLISAIYAGPVAILIWLGTAHVLTSQPIHRHSPRRRRLRSRKR